MTYILLILIVVLPLSLVYYSYKFIDHKNPEPKRAVLFTVCFSVSIFFVEFFLVKPAVGKVIGFYDTYMFVYFLTEEQAHIASLSFMQYLLVILFSSFSKAACYGIGVKVLFTHLYRLGKSRWFARRHCTQHGFLDEPIDYILYSIVYFIILALMDSIVHFRFDSPLAADKLYALVMLFVYISIAIVVSSIWLKHKTKFNHNSSKVALIDSFAAKLKPSNRSHLSGVITNIELWNILCLFIVFLVLKISFVFSTIISEVILLFISFVILLLMLKQVKTINSKEYTIIPP